MLNPPPPLPNLGGRRGPVVEAKHRNEGTTKKKTTRSVELAICGALLQRRQVSAYVRVLNYAAAHGAMVGYAIQAPNGHGCLGLEDGISLGC